MRYSRQSFLGAQSEEAIAACTVGVVGLGGGGSHIVQQLAHVGFRRYVLADGDVFEEPNLNRLVGATFADLQPSTSKVAIAQRVIQTLQAGAQIVPIRSQWQAEPEPLRACDIIFGCVDSYLHRGELEIACRRYLAHYIDIGMDVHGAHSPVIGGQVILSSPGFACMRCMGFLTDDLLAAEAGRYGAAGPRPQVVWPNGVLASTAVGIALEIVTGWTKSKRRAIYLSYNGNTGTISQSRTLRNLNLEQCSHFSLDDIGDPFVEVL